MTSSLKPIRKAVFPVAGLGTRFLPATKAVPKEMLTVVDRPVIQHVVDEARAAGIAISFGYGERTPEGRHFNTSVLTDTDARIIGKYRKIHLPGWSAPQPGQPFQNLEKELFKTIPMQ